MYSKDINGLTPMRNNLNEDNVGRLLDMVQFLKAIKKFILVRTHQHVNVLSF